MVSHFSCQDPDRVTQVTHVSEPVQTSPRVHRFSTRSSTSRLSGEMFLWSALAHPSSALDLINMSSLSFDSNARATPRWPSKHMSSPCTHAFLLLQEETKTEQSSFRASALKHFCSQQLSHLIFAFGLVLFLELTVDCSFDRWWKCT